MAISSNTLIPTVNNGLKQIKDLRVGDLIFTPSGKHTKIIEMIDVGKPKAFDVEFLNGIKVCCDANQSWEVSGRDKNKKDIVTVHDMYTGGPLSTKSSGHKYKVSICEAIPFKKKEYDIDPYVIGAFLAKGSNTKGQLLLSAIDDIYINEICRLTGFHPHKFKDKNLWVFSCDEENSKKSRRINTKTFFKNYPELIETSPNRHIPKAYIFGNIKQRMSLIQGLFDFDGYIDSYGRIRYTSSSKNLIDDIQFVLSSLGVQSTSSKKVDPMKYTFGEIHELSIGNSQKYFKAKIFRLGDKRKKGLEFSRVEDTNDYSRLAIISISPSTNQNPINMTSIKVNSPDNLFLINDFIVARGD